MRATAAAVATADARLRAGLARRDRAAVEAVFAAHGAAAFRVAVAITGDADTAARAVVAAFAELAAAHPAPAVARPLRVEVLDATRRAARAMPSVSAASAADPVWRALGGALTAEQHDVLALAVTGDSTCTEIASVMDLDRASVHRVLRGALAGAGTALGLSA